MEEIDIYAEFAEEIIQVVLLPNGASDPNYHVTLTEAYSEFKCWFRDTFPGNKNIPNRFIFKNELSIRFGKIYNNAWHGIQLIRHENIINITIDNSFDVYLVDGYIEDGMQGKHIILGIFTTYALANKAIADQIGDAKYNFSNSDYEVIDKKNAMIYSLRINKHTLNQKLNIIQ